MVDSSGTVAQVQVSPVRRQPMTVLTEAQFLAGHGIDGDRHAGRTRTRQVLIMDSETQAEFGIGPAVTRENVTTAGLDLSGLRPGMRVRLGESAVVEITGDCDPCSQMDEAEPGLREKIDGRRGMLGRIVTDGAVRPGDAIVVDG